MWTPVMAYHEHCILVQRKLDVLVSFTNIVSYINQFNLSSCLGHLMSWGGQVMLFLYFLWSNLEKLFALIYIHLCLQHIVATYMAPPRPAMYGRYRVYALSGCGISMQLVPHLVGQLLSLFVQVWWSWWHSMQAVVLTWEEIVPWLTDSQ